MLVFMDLKLINHAISIPFSLDVTIYLVYSKSLGIIADIFFLPVEVRLIMFKNFMKYPYTYV